MNFAVLHGALQSVSCLSTPAVCGQNVSICVQGSSGTSGSRLRAARQLHPQVSRSESFVAFSPPSLKLSNASTALLSSITCCFCQAPSAALGRHHPRASS
eukprot:1161627-Pelagomonas_calceolata.AAC.8